MAANKRHDALNAMLERALTARANPAPPPEMEQRILTRLARRKAKSQKKIRVACLVFAVTLLGIAVLRPVDLAQTEFRRFEPVATSTLVVPVPQPEPHVATAESVDVESMIADAQEESLTSDLEIEPLSIAALELPALGHQ
jgi:hypothetical protein